MADTARLPELDPDTKAANVVAFMRERSDNKLSVFELARVVFSTLFECDKRLAKSIERLEAKLAALEQRKAFSYCGVWDGSETYTEGDFATHAGSLWHCNAATSRSRPGTDDTWQLTVKRGKIR
jgi:hypothetical protein